MNNIKDIVIKRKRDGQCIFCGNPLYPLELWRVIGYFIIRSKKGHNLSTIHTVGCCLHHPVEGCHGYV
ncbi:unnamed protein product [marine sediment metagenome]|uniref:Uncharacterized protein n=1 Tax=marine sediment metagenome TaxID=412755 RepID=X0S3L3_9ZZZZ